MKTHFLPLLILSCLMLISCFKDDGVPFPPEVIEVPETDERTKGTVEPVKINERNELIANFGSFLPLGISYTEDFHSEGFFIHSDGSGYKSFYQERFTSNWVFDINEDGVIAGAYLPKDDYPAFPENHLPAYAYSVNKDGTGFTELHPEGFYYSIATHVTEDGTIYGKYGQVNETKAGRFAGEGVEPLLDTLQFPYSELQLVHASYLILKAANSDGDTGVYQLAYGTSEPNLLALQVDDFYYLELTGINSHGQMVGQYLNIQRGLSEGITFDLASGEMVIYNAENKDGKWTFVEYLFKDINEGGSIAGIGGRVSEGFFPQWRAITINWSLSSGFEDITPANGDAYSEAHSITNDGKVLGYLGVPRESGSVVNRLFVKEL